MFKKKLFLLLILLNLSMIGCSNNQIEKTDNKKYDINITSPINVSSISAPPSSLEETSITTSPFATLENTFYFVDWSNNNKLSSFSLENNTLSINTVFNIIPSENIIIHRNYIYFSNSFDEDKLYRFNITTSETEKISNSKPLNILLKDNLLFFIDKSNDYKITTFDIENNKTNVITQNQSSYFSLNGNWIYYENKSDNSKLYVTDLTGKYNYKISNFAIESFALDSEYIYCINSSDNDTIYTINLDTLETKKILDFQAENLSNINNTIYFIHKNKSNKLFNLSKKDESFEANQVSNSSVINYKYFSNNIFLKSSKNPESVNFINIDN